MKVRVFDRPGVVHFRALSKGCLVPFASFLCFSCFFNGCLVPFVVFSPPKGQFGRDASSHLLLLAIPGSTLSQCLVPFALLDPPPGNVETKRGTVFDAILEELLVPNESNWPWQLGPM